MITETSSQEKGMFRKQVFMLQNVEQVVDTADEGVMLCLQDDICMITFYIFLYNGNIPYIYTVTSI